MINSLLKNKTRKQSVRRELELKHPTPSPPPPFLFWGERGLSFRPNLKKKTGRGLTGSQLLEGAVGKEVGDFFHGGCSFYIKNNLKSAIFNDKKSL